MSSGGSDGVQAVRDEQGDHGTLRECHIVLEVLAEGDRSLFRICIFGHRGVHLQNNPKVKPMDQGGHHDPHRESQWRIEDQRPVHKVDNIVL